MQHIPVVCTLSTKDAAAQVLEWVDLQARASSVRRIHGGARMTFPAAMQDAVEDLGRREQACCPFLTISTRVLDNELTLDISSADPDAMPVIEAIAGLGTD